MELTWWSRGEASTLQCQGPGFNPWSLKIPHVEGQLSLCATTKEASAAKYIYICMYTYMMYVYVII